MRRIHHRLRERYKWYNAWHNHSKHNLYHWVILIIISFSTFALFAFALLNKSQFLTSRSLADTENSLQFEVKEGKGKIVSKASDRILVKFKDEINNSKKDETLKKYKASEKSEIKGSKVKIINVPAGRSPEDFVSELKAKEGDTISFAETDDLVTPQILPNDQYYFEQWYYKTIQAEDAWDNSKASNISIGVCDTGYDGTHIDLQTALRTDLGFNTVDNSNSWNDINYHGTMVAGIAAGPTNNIVGVAGTAWDGLIIPVRISNLEDGSAYLSDAAECIIYAADNGAKVVNLSYNMAHSATIDAAAAYAESKGAVTVVSAGNDSLSPGWPDFQTFLAVGATSKDDVRALWSNTGTYIDLTAPGDWILAPYPTTNKYAFGGGTSFAAPLVSGTLGLMFGSKPSLTPSEAKNIILSSVDDKGLPGEDNEYGKGRLNMRKAIEQTLGITITVSSGSATGTDRTLPTTPTNLSATVVSPYQINLSWNPSNDNVAVKGYDIFRTEYCSGFSNNRIAQVTGTTFQNYVNPLTCYEYAIRAVDTTGNVSYNSVIVKAQTEAAPRRSTPPPTPTPTPNTDNIVPSAPTNLKGLITGPESVNISWKGSKDNFGIKYYRIYVPGYPDVNGVRKPALSQVFLGQFKMDETNSTYSYSTYVPPLYTNTFWASAIDDAGNESELSAPISVTMPGLDGFGALKGKVLDSAGKPLPGNGITFGPKIAITQAGSRTTLASSFIDADGSFRFYKLPVGTHDFTISLKGYTTIKGKVTITNKQIVTTNYTLVK